MILLHQTCLLLFLISFSQLPEWTVTGYFHFPPPHYPIVSHLGSSVCACICVCVRMCASERARERDEKNWQLPLPALFPSAFTPQIVWKSEKRERQKTPHPSPTTLRHLLLHPPCLQILASTQKVLWSCRSPCEGVMHRVCGCVGGRMC